MTEVVVGRVRSLHRYPVKSMQGEARTAAGLGERGVLGDRSYALRGADGRVLTAKRTKELLGYTAGWGDVVDPGSDPPLITMSDRTNMNAVAAEVSAVLSERLERTVVVEHRDASTNSFGELDAETIFAGVPIADALAGKRRQLAPDADRYDLAEGAFFDSADLHLLTTGTLAHLGPLIGDDVDLDPRRFRPNVFIESESHLDGFVEDAWIGSRLRLGEVVIREIWPTLRCVMTTAAQPGIERDLRVLKTILREHATNLGAFASVEQPGLVRVGDPVVLLDPAE